jgi:hypothetical protein
MEQREKLRNLILCLYTTYNFSINIGSKVCSEILMLTWKGATVGQNFDVDIGTEAI